MIELLLLTLSFAAGTWLGGWWSIIAIAVVWSLWRQRAPWRAGLAAAISWTVLLGLTIPWTPLSRLAPKLGGVLGLPGWVALLLPPLFALGLGWSAARVVWRVSRVKG